MCENQIFYGGMRHEDNCKLAEAHCPLTLLPRHGPLLPDNFLAHLLEVAELCLRDPLGFRCAEDLLDTLLVLRLAKRKLLQTEVL